MSTRLEVQEELRKRQFQERVLHERRRSLQEKDLKCESERISLEQEKLRKQHQRLEQEKRHYKEHSFLTKDRRLSIPDDKLPQLVTDNSQQSKSAHSPDYTKVRSKLFDFEKSSARSRRQLMQSTEGSPAPSPHPPRVITPMSSHAFEASKASYSDLVKNIARLPQGNKDTDVNIKTQTRPDSITTLPDKELEVKPSSRQTMHSDMKVSFKDEKENVEVPPTPYSRSRRGSLPASVIENVEVPPTPYSRSRRGSLPASVMESLPSPYPQRRRGSLPASGFESPKPAMQRRRHSLPANQSLLPKIKIHTCPDDHENRLTALYNKAIETVQLADEVLLAIDRPALQRLKIRRQSEGGVTSERSVSSASGFDLATLRELEAILSDARTYSNRRSSSDDYSRLDVATNRAQKKRIEHLEQVLKKLNPSYDTKVDIDPVKVLQCSYLRLSKSNVETLENMIRAQGKEPGIHIHMDVTNYDIWKGLKEERTDLQQAPSRQENRRPKKRAIHV